jgi:6-pyruvoyltetrahydropterin/6-carboxytetrahydropterin synthase
MYVLTVREEFCASHALRNYDGKCARPHGHNFKVEVMVRGSQLDAVGMLIDFVELKRHVRELMGYLDHTDLNEQPPFAVRNATAENIARYLYGALAERMPDGVEMDGVTVWETDRAGATYRREG